MFVGSPGIAATREKSTKEKRARSPGPRDPPRGFAVPTSRPAGTATAADRDSFNTFRDHSGSSRAGRPIPDRDTSSRNRWVCVSSAIRAAVPPEARGSRIAPNRVRPRVDIRSLSGSREAPGGRRPRRESIARSNPRRRNRAAIVVASCESRSWKSSSSPFGVVRDSYPRFVRQESARSLCAWFARR